jgi:hypothetical protein
MLHILWDDSHIWGLLAARAMAAMEIPHRLVRGADIAGGLFRRERPSLLLAPGGSARRKAEALGAAGMAAIRAYLRGGGRYLGFCGGAGLALSSQDRRSALALCSWRRAPFTCRPQHFMSGHLHVTLAPEGPSGASPGTRRPGAADSRAGQAAALIPDAMPASPLLPVWWPGRFAPQSGGEITVLAAYQRPGKDFRLADMAVADAADDGAFAAWGERYGLSPAFLEGQPCIIHGRYGKGSYLLSYSHLETPDSPHANLWLAHLLRLLGGFAPARESIPPWRIRSGGILWDDPDLRTLDRLFTDILETGLQGRLLFHRTDWLTGWRTGIPGAQLNNVWAALAVIRSLLPTNAARACWNGCREQALSLAGRLHAGCIRYLLAERPPMPPTAPPPPAVPADALRTQRDALFGSTMHSGGPYQALMDRLDTLARLQLSGQAAGEAPGRASL